MIESRFLGAASARSYALALSTEASLLLLFTWLSYQVFSAHPRMRDAEAALLCAAMGLQNALVSRLSGAVVRTTHLTGVVTAQAQRFCALLKIPNTVYYLHTCTQTAVLQKNFSYANRAAAGLAFDFAAPGARAASSSALRAVRSGTG